MPINFALLFCIPIGILYYFAARWLLRFFLRRYEQKERRAARLFALFGALSIPLIYCAGLVGNAIPGRFGKIIAAVLFAVAVAGFIGPLMKTLTEGKWKGIASNH
jgi:Na+-driven multidrug efflux pump